MKDLVKAIKVRKKYNKMPFKEFMPLLEKHIGKKISKDELKAWMFTGLNNVDLFLHKTNNF